MEPVSNRTIDEGYIKYRCQWIKEDIVATQSVAELTAYRNALYRLNFIGEYSNGIGFGNLSQRVPMPAYAPLSAAASPHFVITGTQTGHLPTLTAADYSLVTDFAPQQNALICKGLRKASSESLTHGVIYASQLGIHAIIHIHSPQLWKRLLNQVPTTRAEVPYGTPEMAAETQRLLQQSPLPQQKILAMAGHEDGIVAFGESLQMAYRVLINACLMTGFMTQSESADALQFPYQQA
ncbi:MAG: putative epimerase [Phormidesmis priestleyi Ana]|uniref:Putative epimerase n=1 Tax=Phormidesmis priestleyi Ana TaxID=1666911 RepID=A0A0P7YY29_9CYAN|nr:MAG: putative epimerase [Phormidesmis priestleyi Ana]